MRKTWDGFLSWAMPVVLALVLLSAIMAAAQAWLPDANHGDPLEMPVGMRILVAGLSVLFVSFFGLAYLIPAPGSRRNWRSLGLVQAFIVALYAEMYGFPLTVYLLASALGLPAVPGVMGQFDGHLLAQIPYRMGWVSLEAASWLVMAFSSALMGLGFGLIYAGWRLIHGSRGRLVTHGVYARIRHPQYAGLMVLTLGLLLHWPTVVSALMWPVIAITYVRLARREERQAAIMFGRAYLDYARSVPAFVPGLAGGHGAGAPGQ